MKTKFLVPRFIFANVACFLTLESPAAIITPTTDSQVPWSNPASVFDANSHPSNVYGLGPGTTMNRVGSDIRDLFGVSYSIVEPRNTLFTDQPQGFVNRVFVVLDSAVQLANYELYLADDAGSGSRSARAFRLYAGATLLDEVTVLDNSGNQQYTTSYGSTSIKISNTLVNAPISSSYTLEFVQNKGISFGGVRGQEFVAFIPEPTSASLAVIGLLFMALRRKRLSSIVLN